MIEIRRVSKSFGRVRALRDVTLSIRPGERVAFVGANGSGKTTLLRALLGLLRVDGTVTIDGTDVAKSPELALASVAYMPQIAPPLEAPVRDVVAAFARLRGIPEKAIGECSSRLGLDLHDAERVRFRDLSGGTKQKLLAALALAARAPVLVCDEPTANLDAESRAAFFSELETRPKHGITLLCSHRLEEVRQLVDRVIELAEGRLERDATVAEIMADERRFRVEVSLITGAPEAVVAFLEKSGFARLSSGRFEALVGQAEKLSITARLMREHDGWINDLSVYHVDSIVAADTAPEQPAARTRLEVVK